MVEPGRRCLGERYELGALIASGGMGQVWHGTDVLLGRPVAVKILRSEYTGDPTFRARFRAEAQNAAALSHPRIAAVYDYGETRAEDGSGETLAYLVMELVPGRPLSEVLRDAGRLDTEDTLRILAQTAAGLAEAHRAGMVHRDVKPANILVGPDGDVKITDFGIAWSARSVALTRTGQVIGTPQYLSPEQAEGRQATPASDVYALGLIGYECLTGHPAFDGENAVTIALKQVRDEPEPMPADLPSRVRALVRRALAKDPEARLADGAAFAAAVEDVRAGRPFQAGPPTRQVPAAAAAAGVGAARRRPPPGRTPGPVGHRGPGRGRAGSRRPRNTVAVVLLPLIGLLAGAGIAAVLLQGATTDDAPPTDEAAQEAAADRIVLDESDYVGRPIDEVAVELTTLGLSVRRAVGPDSAEAPGTVLGVDGAGESLRPGDVVVVDIAGTAADAGPGVATATSAAPPPPAPAAAPATGTSEPTTIEPTTSEPATTEPTASDPTTTEPSTTDPTTTEPSTTEPSTTQPTGTTADGTTPTDPTDGTTGSTEPTDSTESTGPAGSTASTAGGTTPPATGTTPAGGTASGTTGGGASAGSSTPPRN